MLPCVYPRLHQPRADLIVFQLRVYHLYNICIPVLLLLSLLSCIVPGTVSTIQPESGKWELETPL